MKSFRRGLVVGKFCPLHRGHELVIGRALDDCEEVIVISYTKPEFAGCGPAVREEWIGALFPSVQRLVIDDASLARICEARGIFPLIEIPHNDADDRTHREFVGWLCLNVLQKTVDAVFTSEDYGDGFAASLTAYFQKHAGSSSVVRHVCVDRARDAMPISGTMVRVDPHACREFLSPQVYRHFVKRICILGGESSGKTTLAESLAERFGTLWVPEYGRELWDRKSGKLDYEDMLHIATVQVEREIALSGQAVRYLFCDTSPLTTLFYCREMFGAAEPELEQLAARTYDAVFLGAPDFPFVQDGTRRDERFRERQHAWYVEELRRRGMEFSLLRGSLAERVRRAAFALEVWE